MINEERTLKDFEHTSDMLTYGSGKKVWRICEGCGKEDGIIYYNYTNGQKICKSCAKKGKRNLKRGPFNIEYFTTVQKSINDGYVNEFKTFEEFGYYSIDLLCGSHKKVYRICEECGKEDEVKYHDYVRGYIRCNSCSNAGKNNPNYGKIQSKESRQKMSNANSGKNNHMYGKHHSEETKQKMSKNHEGEIRSEETRQRISATHQNISYEEWDGYVKKSPYCPDFNEECRESNRDKYDRRCFLCNRPEEENIDRNRNPRKLSVHHVDMNKDQGCDGHEWKLVPLCMWCHSPMHTERMISYVEYILKDEEIINE